jgi:dipeptidyl aminopeptidase/acylaminoacyl peptidase
MRFLVTLLSFSFLVLAEEWSIERLYTRPFVWGTSPSDLTWSKKGHTLVFTWNAQGGHFMDLYAYHPDQRKLVRLTDFENVKDELNAGEEEKDARLRIFKAPSSGIGDFSVSNDGSRVAFSYKGDLYLVRTDGSEAPFRLTRTKTGEGSPHFSPDGSKLAYTRSGQLHVQDLGNGQLWQATDVKQERLTGWRWSPDGRWFAYMVRRGEGRQTLIPNYSGRFVAARPFPRSVAGDQPQESELFIVASEGGKPLRVEPGPLGNRVYMNLPEWSPDSSKLLVSVTHPGMKRRQVLTIERAARKPRLVHEEKDEKWVSQAFAAWSPDSRQVLFSSEQDGWSHLYAVPAEGGARRQLTKGAFEVRGEMFSFDPQWIGDYIYFPSTEVSPAERHLYRIKPDGSDKRKLSAREGLNVAQVSEDGRHIAWLLADLTSPFDLYVDEHRVTTSPRAGFTNYRWPETRFVQFPSRGDGKMVSAKVLLPPGYRLEDKSAPARPAVVFIHGAGYATSVLKQWGSYNEMRFAFNCYLAHQGYVVLDMDYRGSSGYGRAWRTDVHLHMGGPDLDDVVGGVEYLRGLGNVDMRRIGIWGVSYGGFMTNMAMFQSPDTFRAGASWAAVNDWENYNAHYTTERLGTPERNPEAYRRSSPIHFSSLLKNPLLIVHGMVDNNVLFQDAVQLTEKLIHEGKSFDQIYYPQENHGFVRDETLIDAYRRTAEWFAQHLK